MMRTWVALLALASMNFALKAVGPVLLAGRKLSGRTSAWIDATGQCLLASMVVVALLGTRGQAVDGPLLIGAAAAAVCKLGRCHELVCVAAAVVATAATRFVLL